MYVHRLDSKAPDPAAATSTTPASFAGKTLVLPAVSFGNVGQLAVDILISTALHKTDTKAKRCGEFVSRHVLPVAGADAYCLGASKDGPSRRLATPCEVFHVEGSGIVVMQRRSMCVRGRAGAFAEEVAAWCKEAGFAHVVLLAGADSGTLRDAAMHQGLQRGMVHYVANSCVPAEMLQRAQSEYTSWQLYDQAERDADGELVALPAAEKATLFPSNVHMAGLSKRLHSACEKAGVPLITLVRFVSEGYNVPDGVSLATSLCEHLPALAPEAGQWVPPGSWNALAPTGPVDTNLFY
eukprot:g806.t1